ncbi:testis-expressed protein 19.2-like [Erinaceus europaeus]|uniref:Testis-expressed protein 19.2-like n=1 Tax=Erinaceus europaeus TaxID=9365 RepID=A0A1S2ZU24_ERIEU|nr:testis-expressed protein 19.2-like [Erinaceus europaeus]
MCPPVSPRHTQEGMSQLHAAWMYQLQHGDQLRLCFACFQAAFLDLQDLLESEGWEDEDWDPEPGPSELGVAEDGDAEQQDPEQESVPTELEPQEVVPLGRGPEDADWMQGLPWRLWGSGSCVHWPSPPLPWQGFIRSDLVPGEPMVLELGASQAGDPAEAKAWLLGLQFFSLLGCCEAMYLRKMRPCCALATPGPGWRLLLEPAEMCIIQPLDSPQEHDLQHWQLSLLESPPGGRSAELVPAGPALLKKGFTILSYSPWACEEAQDRDLAAGPASSPGWDPRSPES